MNGTHRFWIIVAVGMFLAVVSVLLARPLLLIGTIGIGIWLFAQQHWFINSLMETRDNLQIDQTVSPDRILTDEATEVRLTVAQSPPSALNLTVEAEPPAASTGSTGSDRTIQFARGEAEDETTFTLTWPVAGSFEFNSPTVTVTDPQGLFHEQLSVDSTPSVVVESRTPSGTDLYVGEGGTRADPGFQYGEQLSQQAGSGIEPLDIREYSPPEEARRIDWKVSARLQKLYVRKYAIERGQETVLIVDHGATMRGGAEGEAKLDYARAIAAGILNIAMDLNTPVGLYTVGDEGISNRLTPHSSETQFRAIHTRLFELQPTDQGELQQDKTVDTPSTSSVVAPAFANQAAAHLQNDDTAFGTQLQPFFRNSRTYIQRIRGDPLVETIRTYLKRLRATKLTFIITDDTARVQTREAVKLASRHSEHVFVFLTPTPLFESHELLDIEATYNQYVEFEEFRRELATIERVSAFEAAPRERLETIFSQTQGDQR